MNSRKFQMLAMWDGFQEPFLLCSHLFLWRHWWKYADSFHTCGLSISWIIRCVMKMTLRTCQKYENHTKQKKNTLNSLGNHCKQKSSILKLPNNQCTKYALKMKQELDSAYKNKQKLQFIISNNQSYWTVPAFVSYLGICTRSDQKVMGLFLW